MDQFGVFSRSGGFCCDAPWSLQRSSTRKCGFLIAIAAESTNSGRIGRRRRHTASSSPPSHRADPVRTASRATASNLTVLGRTSFDGQRHRAQEPPLYSRSMPSPRPIHLPIADWGRYQACNAQQPSLRPAARVFTANQRITLPVQSRIAPINALGIQRRPAGSGGYPFRWKANRCHPAWPRDSREAICQRRIWQLRRCGSGRIAAARTECHMLRSMIPRSTDAGAAGTGAGGDHTQPPSTT